MAAMLVRESMQVRSAGVSALPSGDTAHASASHLKDIFVKGHRETRETPQHGSPPGWLEENDPAGCE